MKKSTSFFRLANVYRTMEEPIAWTGTCVSNKLSFHATPGTLVVAQNRQNEIRSLFTSNTPIYGFLLCRRFLPEYQHAGLQGLVSSF